MPSRYIVSLACSMVDSRKQDRKSEKVSGKPAVSIGQCNPMFSFSPFNLDTVGKFAFDSWGLNPANQFINQFLTGGVRRYFSISKISGKNKSWFLTSKVTGTYASNLIPAIVKAV